MPPIVSILCRNSRAVVFLVNIVKIKWAFFMIDIHTTHIGEVTVIYISGRIDAINVEELNQSINHVLENSAGDKILLHMRDVNYLSAAGLRVLKSLKQGTGYVRIAEPSIRVIEVMQITGLDAVYELHSTLTDALLNMSPS
jgi:anti-sigma B factor antagonist